MKPIDHAVLPNNEFWRRFPDCSFINDCSPIGPAQVIELFGGHWEDRFDNWEPVVVSLLEDPTTDSPSSHAYALLKNADNEFAEVHGSSCSVWAFDGCWELEAVDREYLVFALEHGSFRDEEGAPLRKARAAVAKAAGLDLAPAADLGPKARWEAAQARKAADAAPSKKKKSRPR